MPDSMNPFIAGNPVTGLEMFFGREDVFQFVRQTLMGQHRDNVIVLYGQRRTGKTSLLYHMRFRMEARYLCIVMDMQGFACEGLGGFLWELTTHILRALRRDYQIQLPSPKRAEFMADPRSSFENEVLHQVRSHLRDQHLLLMLDEVSYLYEQVQVGKVEHGIFEYMRYLMQHYEWLNFLFALDRGLEEMEKDYALLFNTGLYKKISFLDRSAAQDLIRQPVKDYYQVDQAAVDRIYRITSGHPYYTQLVCHCLFNRWQHQRMTHIGIQDVDAVLDEAVERGSAVLKYSWEELTPGEKAVVAAMATAANEPQAAIAPAQMKQLWRQYHISGQENESARAIRTLITHDIIIGQELYAFAVDLQRLWVQKHRRLDWVKEELPEHPLDKFTPPSPAQSRKLLSVRSLIIAIAVLFIVSGSLLYTTISRLNQQRVSTTPTAQNFYRQITSRAPVLNNSFRQADKSIQTDPPFCVFTNGTYLFTVPEGYYEGCHGGPSFTNFAFEVQMRILKGDCGGILFRAAATEKYYVFGVCANGQYGVLKMFGSGSHDFKVLKTNNSSAVRTGLNQTNVVAVVANGQKFDLYVNGQAIDSFSDGSYSSGQTGFIAEGVGLMAASPAQTEVAYNYQKVWIF